MPEELKFQFKMEAAVSVQPILRIKTAAGAEHTLAVVEEDIAGALLQLGDREYLGPITMRLRQPVFGQGKISSWRMDSLLLEAEPRTVSLMFIGEEPLTITLDRQKLCRYLRETMKEIARIKEKGIK
ncbi:hypothetical protein EXP36_00160 [Salmonella enterica subsp. enterica serovar Weltevreden]|jgi:hypothetical protein|nr:hypothetical protein [Salmonella enterica]ECB4558094.1 hypothetical protein [Salmonella enterica subsp. enterica serovar Weltevreden]ECD7026945.1 hypothetical protein [Salmonella enterica subsp. enterica serovar Heidelberg]ECE8180740.1 hypothetical protein [Salmonella enterica subsp. enterica serovar Enteritidis]EDK7230861.1 hypothetical protein [Salmonella enterica subsp. enterica serovar Java]MJU45246.1 hypothetical protein [Salmonella enterica subsp. enterica serovar Stanley]QNI20773.1 